mmetsp:Transcript_49282/g.74412  ORF Transcript_49282/g.74412 Transcript_49282/m.74412 type:complete len:142 (-) Transcript_49282:86-511(-)
MEGRKGSLDHSREHFLKVVTERGTVHKCIAGDKDRVERFHECLGMNALQQGRCFGSSSGDGTSCIEIDDEGEQICNGHFDCFVGACVCLLESAAEHALHERATSVRPASSCGTGGALVTGGACLWQSLGGVIKTYSEGVWG